MDRHSIALTKQLDKYVKLLHDFVVEDARIEFRLSMPGRVSWDNRWSGDDRNYTIVRSLAASIAALLDGRTWIYRWPDGWCASITARYASRDERPMRSDGFCGYDWMVDSILRDGRILADHERQTATTP